MGKSLTRKIIEAHYVSGSMKANEFKSSIWVEKEERKVNAKSLLGVLSLGIVKGTPIKLIADGPDEKEAVEALYKMISSDFSE